MENQKLNSVHNFVQENAISVKELAEIADYMQFYGGKYPLIENGSKLPEAVRYADGTVSDVFMALKKIVAIHTNGMDILLEDSVLSLSLYTAKQFCNQSKAKLLTRDKAMLFASRLPQIQETFIMLGLPPLRDGQYWIDSGKKFSPLVLDVKTRTIKPALRNCNYFVRPVRC